MSPKTGRPSIQDVPRNEKLNIRLTKREKEKIQFCAESLGVSRTDAIMQGIRLVEEELNKK